VPQEFETVLASDNRIRVRDLVEEELLLSLPLVPLHADPGDCTSQEKKPDAKPAPEAERPGGTETQRPFERLGELLKRE
jgi:uncharacterized metal-binding protein YceD (DUF177 family)